MSRRVGLTPENAKYGQPDLLVLVAHTCVSRQLSPQAIACGISRGAMGGHRHGSRWRLTVPLRENSSGIQSKVFRR